MHCPGRLVAFGVTLGVGAGLAASSACRPGESASGAAYGTGGLTRTQTFDRDPHWDGRNNRSQVPPPRVVRQEFGYSRTAHAARGAGEIGGFVTPAAEPAYYAKVIPVCSLREPLSASGTLSVASEDGAAAGNTL